MLKKLTERKCLLFLLYFLLISIGSSSRILSFDTYYYWDWSRHLALSYYDGPPMIAYFIKLSTFFFGDTLFALSITGIISTALTSLILFKTARLFLTESASYVALSLWLFSPLVTLDLLTQTTYDTPLTLFWALTLYFVIKYIQTPATTYLYAIGLCIGLLLLSKYSGIILVAGILIFLLTTRFRYLFCNRHFYGSLLLASLVFSPVIIWNHMNEWQSFLYQLTTHHLQETGNPLSNIIKTFIFIMIPSLNIMLLPPLLYGLKAVGCSSSEAGRRDLNCQQPLEKNKNKSQPLFLCFIISLFFLLFYLTTSATSLLRVNWLMQFLMTSALLGGYFYQTWHNHRSIQIMIGVYAFISISILANAHVHFIQSGNYVYYLILQQFNKDYPTPPKLVITPGWFEARMLYFLKGHPSVYTIDCGSMQNQYGLWSKDINENIKSHQVKDILYIDTYDRVACVKKYFSNCQKLSTKDYQEKHHTYHVFAYQCTTKVPSNHMAFS